MLTHRIVCLANSYKHDHRCVAGVDLSTKRWVRLVGRKVPGCLTREQTLYQDGREIRLLDVFEAELGDRCGSNCHPEDVFVENLPWQFLRRFADDSGRQLLAELVGTNSTVLNGYYDRVPMRRLDENAAQCSLGLVRPQDLWWWIRIDKEKRRNRAVFRLGKAERVRYDLPVTDPVWLDQLKFLPEGIYPHSVLAGVARVRLF